VIITWRPGLSSSWMISMTFFSTSGGAMTSTEFCSGLGTTRLRPMSPLTSLTGPLPAPWPARAPCHGNRSCSLFWVLAPRLKPWVALLSVPPELNAELRPWMPSSGRRSPPPSAPLAASRVFRMPLSSTAPACLSGTLTGRPESNG